MVPAAESRFAFATSVTAAGALAARWSADVSAETEELERCSETAVQAVSAITTRRAEKRY